MREGSSQIIITEEEPCLQESAREESIHQGVHTLGSARMGDGFLAWLSQARQREKIPGFSPTMPVRQTPTEISTEAQYGVPVPKVSTS